MADVLLAENAFVSGQDCTIIQLHIQPGAKRDGVAGMFGSAVKIALSAPPVDGKANSALLRFLSSKLGIPKSKITLLSGECSRDKRVAAAGMNIVSVMEKLSK